MLTLEETRWSLNAFKTFSIWNLLPIQVDVKTGKIQRQSSKIRVFIWKILFGIGVSHWVFMFVRLVQSTMIDKEKYFRWDHFVLHFGITFGFAVVHFTGFRLFVKNPEENVMIFNHLFAQREDPVQKMIDQQLQLQMSPKSGDGKGKGVGAVSARGNTSRRKSGSRFLSTTKSTSTSTEEQIEEIEMAVIDNLPESDSNSEAQVRPLLTWSPQYSLDELAAKTLPLMNVFTELFAILILAIDPTRPQLLYSVLPPGWENVWSFLILLAVETLCMTVVASTVGFCIVTQALFFAKCGLEFKRLSLQLRNLKDQFQNRSLGGREIEREFWILRQISKEMRELVLFIELFNRCFPFCIFAWKIFSLTLCILLYFFAIRHHEDFPFLGSFIGYCAVATNLTYTILYSNSSSIPRKMEDLKKEFLLTAQKTTSSNSNENKKLRAEMKREVKRIQNVGVKVGSFHQMEREFTPIFIDFVFRNVVTLLVTFPR